MILNRHRIKRFHAILAEFRRLSILRTCYYNLKLFGIIRGLKFPIFIYNDATLKASIGNIILPNYSPGIIKIGVLLSQLTNSHTVITINGGG